MSDINRIHFIGIAGSGMSGLALMAHSMGLKVSGSDKQASTYLDAVLAAGIPVSLEQVAANVSDPDIDVVVASTAIPADNPELAAARERGLTVWPRARMLAWLGESLSTLAVAGTHGKTTTSAMLATTLAGLGADPSFVIGGVLVDYDATARLGQGSYYVVEADESDESFTHLSPQLMILTNIERDHMDHYQSIEHIQDAFSRFIDTLAPGGTVIYCIDNPELTEVVRASGRRAVSYGFSQEADYRCIVLDEGFEATGPAGSVRLGLAASPGVHNMLNATGVLAAVAELGYELPEAAVALAGFGGVRRRFELIGERRGVKVVDDYGHHPTKVKATLAAAQRLGYRRVHVLFQPHRYTRTSQLFDEFIEAFGDADSLLLLEIYSAGEKPIEGITSQALADAINAAYPGSGVRLVSRDEAPGLLASMAGEGDLIITLGAGDVTQLAPLTVEALDGGAGAADSGAEDGPGAADADAGDGTGLGASSGLGAGAGTGLGAGLGTGSTARQAPTWEAPIFEAYCELEGTLRGSIQLNEPMARHTSFRIGGPAGLYIECANLADLKHTLDVVKRYGLAWAAIGKGTNLLVSDRGFEGAVITLGREFKNYRFPGDAGPDGPEKPADEGPEDFPADDGTPGQGEAAAPSPGADPPSELLVAGAGVLLGNLVRSAFKEGYSGLEFAVGIPGTLGGALFMNAGSADEWISQAVASVLVLGPDGALKRYYANDLPWQYRSSGLPLGEVILEAELKVSQGNAGHIRARMEGIMRRRQRSQPLSKPNAGSIFKNPEGAAAGQLIDSLGLKGLRAGGALVSEVHANFIVNDGSATAEDVITLIQEVRKRVRESYGFELQTEIRFIGF